MEPEDKPPPTFWDKFWDVTEGAFLNVWDNTLYVVAATGIGYLIFIWLRNRPSVQERIMPLLDDVRRSIVKALGEHQSMTAGTDSKIMAAAIIGASILCSFTLLAFALIISNFGTPVG